MVNKVMLVGNLGRDPEMRALPGGQQVANFSLATSRRYKDRDGNRKDETEWHNIVVYGKQAEIAGQYLTKGKMVFVEGRIQTRSWDDKESEGKKHLQDRDHLRELPDARLQGRRPQWRRWRQGRRRERALRAAAMTAAPASSRTTTFRSRAIADAGCRRATSAARRLEPAAQLGEPRRRRRIPLPARRAASAGAPAGVPPPRAAGAAPCRPTAAAISGASSSRRQKSRPSQPAASASAPSSGSEPNSASAPISRSSLNSAPRKPDRFRSSVVAIMGLRLAGRISSSHPG